MSTHTYTHHRARSANGKMLHPNTDLGLEADQAYPPFGGYSGCAYTGFGDGIVCQNNTMLRYHPSNKNWGSHWVSNVNYHNSPQFHRATIKTPGGLSQIMMGGGSGFTPCAEACSCQNDPDCTCSTTSKCGWPIVGQNCMEPVPGGNYLSLTACEHATATGTGTN